MIIVISILPDAEQFGVAKVVEVALAAGIDGELMRVSDDCPSFDVEDFEAAFFDVQHDCFVIVGHRQGVYEIIEIILHEDVAMFVDVHDGVASIFHLHDQQH